MNYSVETEISRLCDRILSDIDNELELEVRIGFFRENGTFDTNFGSKKQFSQLIESMFKNTTWMRVEPNVKFATRYFNQPNLRGRYFENRPPEIVEKIVLSKVDIHCPNRPYGIRITLSREIPKNQDILTHKKTQFIRLQRRWSFIYKDSSLNVWRYDLTSLVSGKDRESAMKSTPRFEVELELVKPGRCIKKEILTKQFLSKISDLVGNYNSKGERENLSLKLIQIWNS